MFFVKVYYLNGNTGRSLAEFKRKSGAEKAARGWNKLVKEGHWNGDKVEKIVIVKKRRLPTKTKG